MLQTLLRQTIDFCYPRTCANCDAWFEEARDQCLCDACDVALQRLEAETGCDRCAAPMPAGAACGFCGGDGLYPYERVLRLGRYDDPLRSMIHQVKYQRRWAVAVHLADRMLSQEPIKTFLQYATLVPVPLYAWRRLRRGYNQADLLARRLSVAGGIPVARPAIRWRATQTQTNLHSRAKRADNLRNAFALTHPASIAGRHVVVIDDVMTTGATLAAFARALLPAKPASLCAVVLAVADPRGRDFQRL